MPLARALIAVSALMLAAPAAHAGGFTPWGGPTGDKNMALSPYLFVSPTGAVTTAPYVFFGATDHFDILLGYSFTLDHDPANDTFTSGAIEIMPRGFITPAIGFGIHALYVPGADTATLGVELNGMALGSIFGITYNTGWWPTIGGDAGFDPGVWFAILAPEVYVDRANFFLEFNPTVTLAEPAFGLNIVPGVGFAMDEERLHFLSAAATIRVAPEYGGVTFGLLYNHTISLAKKSKGESEAAARLRQHSRSMQPTAGRF